MSNKMKKFVVPSLLLSSTVLLAACSSGGDKKASDGGKGESNYSYVYSTDINSLDYTFSSRTSNSDHFANFVEGLLENDQYGNLKPALAKSWEVSDDGLTYTYHLRKGVKWVDNEGNDYAEVKAQDFVTGLKHAVDVKSETLYVVQDSIKGLDDYVKGATKDFSTVGVKAVDDYTLQYTLARPESYWNSKLTYGILFPVNEEFLKSKGKDFGQPSPDSILYNSAYILTNNTAKSVIEYKKNDSYWDKKHVYINNIKLTYYDGTNPDSLFKEFDQGNYTVARVYPNSGGYKDVEAKYGDAINFSRPTGTTYNMTFNFDRKAYNATSKKTDAEKDSTHKAIMNKNFRLAVEFAINKTDYNAQNVGKTGAENAIRNMLTPDSFVTIDGKNYGDVVQEKLAKLDPDTFSDVKLADSQEGWFNADKAKSLFEKAKSELQAQGVQFPIHLDLPQDEKTEVLVNQAKSLKHSIESTLGKDNVVIDIQLLNEDKYLAATYQATTAADQDYDISTASGWGPDYQDPSTYLDIYDSRSGAQLQNLGLEPSEIAKDNPSAQVVNELKLAEYDALLDKAAKFTAVEDVNKRYDAYADAEAWLTANALQIPLIAFGATPSVSKLVPFNAQYSWTGLAKSKFKGVKIQDKAVTTKEYQKALKNWEEKRLETAENTK
ncbi:peptide ABC transporter substrate-binding protein [Enterococcus cecorum]|uniref:peptide ABC transporter substrate-binding protein n=1 Tax=Enterococcus cecorum TaxID=44008 RepID=UPI001FAC0ECF|nr:peptide ABC transporter substrate-binding protein [Enterococcus cecorum]MCJ0592653.1 peptide ABC transporter substrate-binding protein [Enterococcus cecorum]